MYTGRVLIGNWLDRLQIESELREKQAQLRSRGQLPIQSKYRLLRAFLRSTPLPKQRTSSNFIEYNRPLKLHAPEIRDLSTYFANKTGCPNQIVNEGDKKHYGLILTATTSPLDLTANVRKIDDGCGVACTAKKESQVRSIFQFVPADLKAMDSKNFVRFGRHYYIQLTHTDDKLYLRSEPPLIDGRFGPNYHNPVRLNLTNDCYAIWRPVHWDKNKRFETEGSTILPCTRMVIQHVMTNQCLAVERLNWHHSLLGFECGVTVFTYSDIYGNETSECIWNTISNETNLDQ